MWSNVLDNETRIWAEKVANDSRVNDLHNRIDEGKVRLQMQRFKEEVLEAKAHYASLKEES